MPGRGCPRHGYDEYDDLPDGANVRAYSPEEIAAEKVVALGDRARNEPRDLYDIWYLTGEGRVDLAHLRGEVEAKLDFRGKKVGDLAGECSAPRSRSSRSNPLGSAFRADLRTKLVTAPLQANRAREIVGQRVRPQRDSKVSETSRDLTWNARTRGRTRAWMAPRKVKMVRSVTTVTR